MAALNINGFFLEEEWAAPSKVPLVHCLNSGCSWRVARAFFVETTSFTAANAKILSQGHVYATFDS